MEKGECFERQTTIADWCQSDRCKLYYTKTGIVPAEYLGLLSAANILSERAKRGLRLFEKSYPFWAIEAYKANERTFEKAESEYSAKMNEPETDDSLGLNNGGDSDAFAAVEQQMGIVPKQKQLPTYPGQQ